MPLIRSLSTPALRVLQFFCLVALGICSYLALNYGNSHLAGCGGAEGGCASVLSSRWSSWLLLPVSAFAAALWAAVFLLTLTPVQRRTGPAADLLLGGAGLLLVLAALWFMAMMIFVEKGFCPWCTATHVIGLGVGITLVRQALRASRDAETSRSAIGFAGGAAAFAILALGQVFGPRADTHQMETPDLAAIETPAPAQGSASPAGSRVAVFFGGALKMDTATVPVIGDPNAEFVFAECFDYTCRSCREMHGDLKSLEQTFPGKFAVIALPTPLNRACNPAMGSGIENHESACELARLALSLWLAAPHRFREFHEFLMATPLPVSVSAARDEAVRMASEDDLARAEADPWIQQQLSENVRIYGNLSAKNARMPKLILGAQVMHGPASTPERFLSEMAVIFARPAPDSTVTPR